MQLQTGNINLVVYVDNIILFLSLFVFIILFKSFMPDLKDEGKGKHGKDRVHNSVYIDMNFHSANKLNGIQNNGAATTQFHLK